MVNVLSINPLSDSIRKCLESASNTRSHKPWTNKGSRSNEINSKGIIKSESNLFSCELCENFPVNICLSMCDFLLPPGG